MAYPELIYLYVEDFGYCFQKQEFVFSLNYDVKYAKAGNRTLTISPKKNPFKEIYGDSITNISLLVGSNGSGKTSVMELLARPETFVENLQRKFPRKVASMGWFSVYAVDVPGRGELRETTYYLEGWNAELIANFKSKPSETQQIYSYYFSMDGGEIVCFSRGNISDKLQLYYCPIGCRSFSFQDKPSEGVLKSAIKLVDSWNFFRFISINRKQIEESVYAENVEFSIKVCGVACSKEESDIREFQGMKDRFLFNMHCEFMADLINDLESDEDMFFNRDFYMEGLPKEVLQLYYEMLDEAGYNNVSVLCGYDKGKNIDSESTIPAWFREDESSQKKALIKDIQKCTKMLAALSQLDEKYFVSEQQVDIPARESLCYGKMKDIFDYFEEYRKEGEYREDSLDMPSIRCEYRNISEGEEAFLKFFSSVMQSVEKMPKRDSNVYGTRVLLLDEPDLSMHPEWSRTFLKNLTELLSRVWVKERTAYQIIVSTHSPFMISDVLKENVLCFEREQESRTIQVRPSRYGLLSNIHDIMADSFFLNSPFGELGNNIFDKKIICMIKEITSLDDTRISMISAYISAIGDHFVWLQVNALLQNKLQELSGSKEDNTQKRIQILEDEIRALRRNSNDVSEK